MDPAEWTKRGAGPLERLAGRSLAGARIHLIEIEYAHLLRRAEPSRVLDLVHDIRAGEQAWADPHAKENRA